jgi:ABC-type multidrug transport system fused ATPase/permease subunit
MTMTTVLFVLLGTVLWFLKAAWLAVLAAFAWLLKALWPVWVMVALLLGLATACRPVEAGWSDWFWGTSNDKAHIEKIERSAELAQEAARVTSEAVRAQAKQATAQAQQAAVQAQQNTRVAELLKQLSGEREQMASRIESLSRLSMRDSKIAAVLNAAGPWTLCLTILLVAALALWLTNRPASDPTADLATAVDIMAEEIAVMATTPSSHGHWLRVGHGNQGHSNHRRLVGPEHEDAEADADAEPEPVGPMPF